MANKRVNSGSYRNVGTLQSPPGKNEYGEMDGDWIDVSKIRFAIYPMSAKEFFAAETVNSEVSHKIYMRFLPQVEIKPNMRIKFGSRFFELIGPPINYEEKNHQLLLMCKEVI